MTHGEDEGVNALDRLIQVFEHPEVLELLLVPEEYGFALIWVFLLILENPTAGPRRDRAA